MAFQHHNSDSHDDFIKSLTYQRGDLAGAVIDIDNLKKKCPLDNFLPPTPDNNRTPASLGKLETLPLELIHEVILSLDLQTLTNFRAVNSTARALVNSNPAYRNIITHAPEAIRAYIATTLGSSFSTAQLFNTLCAKTCAQCNDFGGFLFLPNCTRCCWACLTQHPDLLPISPGHAQAMFGLPEAAAPQVPIMQSVPGLYRIRMKSCNMLRPEPLVSKTTARRIGSAIHGSRENMESHVANIRAHQEATYEKETAIYRQKIAAREGPVVEKPAAPPFSGDVDQKDDDVRRLLGVIPFPTLDRRTGKTQAGVSCKGCTNTLPVELISQYFFYPVVIGSGLAQFDGRKRDLARMYTEEEYLKHYEMCGRAQELWELKSNVPESPESPASPESPFVDFPGV